MLQKTIKGAVSMGSRTRPPPIGQKGRARSIQGNDRASETPARLAARARHAESAPTLQP